MKKLGFALAVLIFCLSLFMLLWAILPPLTETDSLPFFVSPDMVLDIEERSLDLEFPPHIRAGGSETVRLTLERDLRGNLTPIVEVDGRKIEGERLEIADLYESHNIVAESRLEMYGVQVLPADLISEPLLKDEKVTFYWRIRAQNEGKYAGRVWLYLRYIPKENEQLRYKDLKITVIRMKGPKIEHIQITKI